jgi:general secretion pathway protein F
MQENSRMSALEPQIVIEPPVEITPGPSPVELPSSPRPQKTEPVRGIGTKAICRFVHQLSTLLHAGMPLVPALSALLEQMQGPAGGKVTRRKTSKDPFVQVITRIRNDVNEGSSLAEAVSRYPGLFSPLFINMIAAGESSGALEDVLSRLSEILEKRVQLLGKVRAALAYPAIMALVAVSVVVFLLSYVVPSITQLFTEMNQQLPWPTRLLMGISGFAQAHSILIFLFPCVVAGGVYAIYRTHDGRLWMDRARLALPLLGPLVVKVEVARLTRTLGTCLKSGIPVMTAIEIAHRVVQNQVVADAVAKVRESIQKGQTIADAFRATGMFPPVVFHLLATGQMSGNVEDAMTDIAEMYETEVETTVQTLTVLLEPLILLVMGAVIGFIVLAILLPIFQINQAL